jgi:hypothetical protein
MAFDTSFHIGTHFSQVPDRIYGDILFVPKVMRWQSNFDWILMIQTFVVNILFMRYPIGVNEVLVSLFWPSLGSIPSY